MKKILFYLPILVTGFMVSCAPYPPAPYPPQPPVAPNNIVDPNAQPTITDLEQQQIQEGRERIENAQQNAQNNSTQTNQTNTNTARPNYPTAARVPGKEGFVFNPYTHNIVNVKGIASGKLVRDPEDKDPTHKFRVP